MPQRSDRRVHASNADWELVRYDVSGHWYAEWVGEGDPPPSVGPSYLDMRMMKTNRCRIYLNRLANVVDGLGLDPVLGLPGGGAFDVQIRRHSERCPSDA